MPGKQKTMRDNALRIRSVAHQRGVQIALRAAVIQALFSAWEFACQILLNPAINVAAGG
jgi:hypothetical protein